MLIELDLGHILPSTLPLAISNQELMFKGEVDICLIPDTILIMVKVNMVDSLFFKKILLVAIGELDLGTIPDTIPPKEDIVGVMVQDMEVVLKRSTTRTCSMLEKVFMELLVVDLDLGPALLPPIIQVIMLDHLLLIVMVIAEVDIGITPEKFLHKTMVG